MITGIPENIQHDPHLLVPGCSCKEADVLREGSQAFNDKSGTGFSIL